MNTRTLHNRCQNPQNILITRLSAIGDCVATIPLAVEAKKIWPDSRITWLVDCAAESLLRDHSCIDEVIRIEKKWLTRPGNWSELRDQLQANQFDLALDPQGLSKSSLAGWLSGARTRVGFGYSHAREIAPLVAKYRVRRTHRHMVDTYRELLSPWKNILPGDGEFAMPTYEEEASTVSQQLVEMGLNSRLSESIGAAVGADSPAWVAINPGAGWTTRLWPVERFGKLARSIFDRHGLQSLVFWAGESERLMASVIVEESQGAARMAPETNLRALAEYLRRCHFLVTGDTGPMHVASAVEAPTISLNGPTWGDECGPYGNKHIVIQSPAPRLSKKHVRSGPNTAMQAIELEEVQLACKQMLGRLAASTAASAA